MRGGDGYFIFMFQTGNNSTCHCSCIDLHQATVEYACISDTVDTSAQLRKLSAALYFKATGFLIQIYTHDFGKQLHKQNHSDYTKRICDTVSNGC